MQFDENMSLSKMEKNILEEIKGKELWGDIDFSENDYLCLRERIKEILESNDSVDLAYICRYYPCCVTTFLIFMLRFKYNTSFWYLMETELDIASKSYSASEVGEAVRKTFAKHNFDFSDVKDEKWVNIEPIIYEAGLPPESGLDDLFYILSYDNNSVFDPLLIIEDLIGMRSYHIRKPMLRFLKRFKDDRAIEFVLEVHDSMLAVDQNRGGDSRYVARYSDWKDLEKTKEYGNSRKKQENQTRPKLSFENGKRGLCMVLPRIVLENEWIEDVEWVISFDNGESIKRRMSVLGDDGRRYIQSMDVPVCPSSRYKVVLKDREAIEGDEILKWEIEGIKDGSVAFFNANGRMTYPNYLLMPYCIMILSKSTAIAGTKHITTTYQSYPTDRENYQIITIQPDGRDAELAYTVNGVERLLKARPQISMSFQGRKLFSITEERCHLFTEIPNLLVNIDESLVVEGLEIRLLRESICIDNLFVKSVAEIDLKKCFKRIIKKYGTYSITLYRNNQFLRQIEFSYVPKIKSNYSPIMQWPDKGNRKKSKIFSFEHKDDWALEFDNCIVNNDEEHYLVECPSNVCAISCRLRSMEEDNTFSCLFELPVNPISIEIPNLDSEMYGGIPVDEITDKVTRVGFADIENLDYWICMEFFGEYKDYEYHVLLRSANGVEQEERVRLSQNGCGNINLNCFYDTIRCCPLPAQIELSCEVDEQKVLPIIVITDTMELSARPSFHRQENGDYISLAVSDAEKDISVKKFGREYKEYTLAANSARFNKNKDRKGYLVPERLAEGIYTVEEASPASEFFFEDEKSITITNGRNVLYVTTRERNTPIGCISDWLDQLIRDILSAGVNKDIRTGEAWKSLPLLQKYEQNEINDFDYERMVVIAEFANAKCVESKKRSLHECMRQVSYKILNGSRRLDMIRVLSEMNCEKEVFDICLQDYNLLLFEKGSSDAKQLARKLESHSAELAMLLLMGVDAPVRETIFKEKFREIIGKEAIRSLLSVPGESDMTVIAEEQKKFLREVVPCKVRINLTSEISGDMHPIQDMIEYNQQYVWLNKKKKPDFGIYFDHIRYVDQYVNWYCLSHDREGDMHQWKREMMQKVVRENCIDMLGYIKDLMLDKRLHPIISRYEDALRSRTTCDPRMNLNANNHSRYFYLQGLAAFYAVLPREYRKHGWIVRLGEEFMSYASSIAPRISRRDLIMASTFIYLMRKEEQLCR